MMTKRLHLGLCLVNGLGFVVEAFLLKPTIHQNTRIVPPNTGGYGARPHSQSSILPRTSTTRRHLTPIEQEIGFWTAAFATTHIGMSAIRRDLIDGLGTLATRFNCVGRPDWQLPDLWPGDEVGQQAIFPTADIAGRQLYRIFYTMVSFGTLGAAGQAFWQSLAEQPAMSIMASTSNNIAFQWIATLAWAISIASLFNPTPLSLVPVYEAKTLQQGEGLTVATPLPVLERKDSRKLQAFGMTRITRHPLILPVAPWGWATALQLGGHPRDFFLFGGLALYAIAGCWAQDFRVIRQEGSVGTVFFSQEKDQTSPLSSISDNKSNSLQDFFDETSFIPFGAVLDGRQSLSSIVQEVPWWALAGGIGVGYKLQEFLVHWIQAQ